LETVNFNYSDAKIDFTGLEVSLGIIITQGGGGSGPKKKAKRRRR
jgi:hypothetical protein